MIKTIATATLLLSTLAYAAPEPALRLIERADGSRVRLTEDQVLDLAWRIHRETGRCGGFMDITESPTDERLSLASTNWFLGPSGPAHQDKVEPRLAELSSQQLMGFVTQLSSFQTRYHKSVTGAQAARWVADQFRTIAASRTDVTVSEFKHSFTTQPSVIARIEGQGKNAAETVVLGGHLDSINWQGVTADARSPGADDNASGIGTLLEIYRVLIASGYRPDRSIEFIGYASEEVGLLGSQDIAQAYKKLKKNVVGVIQFDMTLFPGKAREITLINDQVDLGMTKFLGMLIDEYVKVRWGEGPCGYACSDHASWTKNGYPSAFPFEGPVDAYNPKIHTENDTIVNGLDGDHGLGFAKLGLAFAVEMGSVK